jgi:prephenate dehydrogenase
VPGHPISGAEKSGPLAARADLFKDKRVVLTPVAETDLTALEKVKSLWEQAGAEVHMLDAAQHDRVFAAVSHLPHLLSYALVEELASRPDADLIFSYAAGGFRDFTRIAASHPTMWRDISLANREALLKELDAYSLKLDELRSALAKGDGPALLTLFQRAQIARTNWSSGLN